MSRNVKLVVGFLILVVIALVGFLAYDLGSKSSNSTQNPITVQNTPTPTVYQTPNSLPSSSPTVANKQTISAGGILVFPAYSLVAPSDWTATKEKNENMDNLTLLKGNYKIVISQAASGGGGCTYPGEPPQEMTQTFTSFVEITNPNGFLFRRGPAQGSPGAWTVCEKRSGSFGFPTSFGNITITAPTTPDASIMAEVDGILASLNKK